MSVDEESTPIYDQVSAEFWDSLASVDNTGEPCCPGLTDELLRKLQALEGLTDSKACETLFHLATMVPKDQAIVELGVYTGKSLCWLACGARSAGVEGGVWGIDLWELHPDRVRHKKSTPAQDPIVRQTAKRQIEEMGFAVGGLVTLIRDFTTAYALRYLGPKVGLLYIDADHTRDAVLADFAAWRNHLAEDAVIVFDDFCQQVSGEYATDRVRDAVLELCEQSWIVDLVESDNRFAICRKGNGPDG